MTRRRVRGVPSLPLWRTIVRYRSRAMTVIVPTDTMMLVPCTAGTSLHRAGPKVHCLLQKNVYCETPSNTCCITCWQRLRNCKHGEGWHLPFEGILRGKQRNVNILQGKIQISYRSTKCRMINICRRFERSHFLQILGQAVQESLNNQKRRHCQNSKYPTVTGKDGANS